MAGKSVLEAQTACCEKKGGSDQSKNGDQNRFSARAKPGPGPTVLRDHSNQTFVVDGTTGHAYFLSLPPTSTPSPPVMPPDVHFSALATDDVASLLHPSIVPSMTSANIMEYSWLALQDELMASVDWHTNKRTVVDLAAISVSCIDATTRRTPVSLETSPFLLDSACTTHISPDRSDFISLHPINNRFVKGVGGSSITAVGIGSIKLVIAKGTMITLENVLFIPASTVRLLSIACLTDSLQCTVSFDSSNVLLQKRSGSFIVSGSRLPAKNLYKLNCSKLLVEHAFIGQLCVPTLDTWHHRLGHTNNQSIYDMATKRMASGMPVNLSTSPPKCDHCILGKQVESPVPKVRSGECSVRRLGIIWVDLTGPEAVVSAMGNHYVMNVVDNHTSFPWTFLLKQKSDAFPTLKAWALQAESEVKERISIIRSDNGELKSGEMDAWCDSNGYTRQYTAPYTSSHIGRVERLHLTIMNKACTMHIQTGLPPNRWDEFCQTSGYLSARTPSWSIGKTPYKAWFGVRPDLSHLREIGSRAFVLIQSPDPKIYPRSYECVLIGYSTNAKTYCCYHRASHKVVESFHVKFIKHKGDVAWPLQPGRILPGLPTPTAQVFRLATIEEEPDIDAPTPTPYNPFSPLAPILELCEPDVVTDVTGGGPASDPFPDIPHEDPTPAPAVDVTMPPPRRSARNPAPSECASAATGVPYINHVSRTSDESRASTRHVKEECTLAKDNHRHHVLELRTALQEEPPNFCPGSVPHVDPSLLAQLPFASEDEIALLQEAFAASSCPDNNPDDPPTLADTLGLPDHASWLEGIHEELNGLRKMGVYKLVPRSSVPAGHKILKGKWVFRLKHNENAEPVHYKAHLCVKGFLQVFGQDYLETTSPTAQMESICILLHIAASMNWDVHQVDIKTAFLYGLLTANEVQWMEQPEGFVTPGKEDWVWELQRGLYGMKQSGRIWNKTMNKAMASWGFMRLTSDPCLFYQNHNNNIILAAVHVDNFLIAGSSTDEINSFKRELCDLWSISDLGEATFCVGIAISCDRSKRTVSISQTALLDCIVTQFGQSNADPISTPMDENAKLQRLPANESLSPEAMHDIAALPYQSLVGSLMYLAIGTCPDIAYAVSKLTQFLDCYRRC
jgi:hypothetical protein